MYRDTQLHPFKDTCTHTYKKGTWVHTCIMKQLQQEPTITEIQNTHVNTIGQKDTHTHKSTHTHTHTQGQIIILQRNTPLLSLLLKNLPVRLNKVLLNFTWTVNAFERTESVSQSQAHPMTGCKLAIWETKPKFLFPRTGKVIQFQEKPPLTDSQQESCPTT